VDRLPKDCNDCEYLSSESGCHYDRFYCDLLDESIKVSKEYLSRKDVEGLKPDWCPLVSKSVMEKFIVRMKYCTVWECFERFLSLVKENE